MVGPISRSIFALLGDYLADAVVEMRAEDPEGVYTLSLDVGSPSPLSSDLAANAVSWLLRFGAGLRLDLNAGWGVWQLPQRFRSQRTVALLDRITVLPYCWEDGRGHRFPGPPGSGSPPSFVTFEDPTPAGRGKGSCFDDERIVLLGVGELKAPDSKKA